METQPTTLEVTVHKSHLVTIGERLYGEAVELLRELVNNAYDADATEVRVTITPEQVVVEDNGIGMDLDGLRQYFNIGSPEKRFHRTSPKFGRERIGEFGIGKFASLSAARQFAVWTKHGRFQATVSFDKAVWEQTGESWALPLRIEPPDPERHEGTVVTLRELTKTFDLTEVERRLIETVPIKAPDFTVFLNGRKLTTRPLTGQHIPFLEGTPYGVVHGEIVLVPASQADTAEAGIACRVRQVLVRRDFFGMESWGPITARIVGEVHADFLPLTSDRSDFIRDAPEYQAFRAAMEQIMARVRQAAAQLLDVKENRRTRRVLSDVLERVREALIRNPDYCPEGLIPVGGEASTQGPAGAVSTPQPVRAEDTSDMPEDPASPAPKKTRTTRPQVKRLTPSAVIKRLKLGRQGLSCCVDHLGADGPECYTEGTVVYLNRDHPLHRRFAKHSEAYELYITRLLTQEIALMKPSRSPRHAFERQSKLLRDALAQEPGAARKQP